MTLEGVPLYPASQIVAGQFRLEQQAGEAWQPSWDGALAQCPAAHSAIIDADNLAERDGRDIKADDGIAQFAAGHRDRMCHRP